MKTINWMSVLLVLCLSLVSCTAASVAEAPAAVEAPVKRFVAFYFHSYKRGLPGKSQLPELASFLTPELLELFAAGIRGEACYHQNNNGGPPLVEGDLFSSLFEGATSATYRPIVQKSDEATFEMEWTNDGRGITSPPEPFVWKDQVLLVRTPSGWRIADFAHLGTWEFMKKWPVSEILRDVAKECATGRQHNL